MEQIIFDPTQIKDGFNKHGHYQFGKHTCPYCKSDKTSQEKDKSHRKCDVCGAVIHTLTS